MAWEYYIDQCKHHDKKCKPEPKGKEGDLKVSIDVPDTPPLTISQTATSQVSGSVTPASMGISIHNFREAEENGKMRGGACVLVNLRVTVDINSV